jgi:hypothetical protein
LIIDFVEFIEAYSELTFYPNSFPKDEQLTADDTGIIRLTPLNRNTAGGVGSVQLQVITRATHPNNAEKYAMEILKSIKDKTSFFMGEYRIIHVKIDNPFPMYIGTDENNRYKYTFNADVLLEI